VKQTRQHSPLPLHTSDVRFEWTQKVTRDQLAMQLSSVQMMSRALLVAGAVLSTSFAAKLAAAPSIQQDGIVSLLASSSPVAGTMAAKNKAAEMEQMVLLLAQQAKVARKSTGKADGDVQVFVDMIKKELAKMEAKIKEAAGIVDASCKDTFANLSAGCPIYAENTTFLPSGFDGDFGSLREAHSTCRSQISSRKQEMDSCKSSRESLILQEHTLTSQFRSINIFESPEECSVKGTDVLGYLASMRDHFDGKKTTWWATYYKLENVTKNITKWNCTEKELAYYDKLAECAQKQLGLEETACELHARTKEACALLPSCFNKNWKNYAKQVALANATISDNEELEEGKACVNAGAQNGVRLLKNRYGQAVGTGSCCTSETNKVVKAEAKQCDGYKDEYTKFAGKYFTATSLIRGTSYYSVREAEIACLKMGHKCWGLFDDKCDMGNLMLVDGALNITESSMHESHQSSCIYQKLKA